MSNFMEKISNKLHGNEAEQTGEYASESHDAYQGQKSSQRSGNTRTGQQNMGSKNEQQFSTGSGAHDQYSTQQTRGQGLDDSRLSGSQGYSNQGLRDDTLGSNKHQSSDFSSGNRARSSGQEFSSAGGAYGAEEESGLGSGRQTRSQASQGSNQQSMGGISGSNRESSDQQGAFAKQAEELGRKGFERGVQEGQKYVNRNL